MAHHHGDGSTPDDATRAGRIWLSAQVKEEIQEVIWLLAESGVAFSEVLVDAPAEVLEDLRADLDPSGIGPIRFAPYSYSTRISVGTKLQDLAVFLWRVLRRRPQLIFSGFSMMKHRVASGVLRIPHLAYQRGVVFDPEVSVGISDRVRFSRLGRLVPGRIVMNYGADEVFTIGRLSREFLLQRGLPDASIHVIGPVWLDPKHLPPPVGSASLPPMAYFVTTAWKAHGLDEADAAQLRITRSLAAAWVGPERFALRVHPRDLHPYETDPAFAECTVDRTAPATFLASLRPDDLLIAPLSTLAFEALFLHRRVIFFADDTATASYNHIYDRLAIEPCSVAALLAGDRPYHRELPEGIFSDLDYSPVRHSFRNRALTGPTAAHQRS